MAIHHNHLAAAVLVAAAGAFFFAVTGSATDNTHPVTWITPGSGLIGGGTGPTVAVGIGAGKVTTGHIQDGTIALADLSSRTVNALIGQVGPRGATGAQGPAGPKGDTGPAGPAGGGGPIASTILDTQAGVDVWQFGPESATYNPTPFATQFTLTEHRTVRFHGQFCIGAGTDDVGWYTISAFLTGTYPQGGELLSAATCQLERQRFGMLYLDRVIHLPPGDYTITILPETNSPNSVVACGILTKRPCSYLEVEIY